MCKCKRWIKSLAKEIADYFNLHWIQKIVIIFFPTVWISLIMKTWGDELELSKNGNYTTKGVVCTAVVFGAALFVNVISSYKSKLEKQREIKIQEEIGVLKSNLGICETVMESIYDICDSKYDTLADYMDIIQNTEKCEKPFLTTVQPTKQLKAISDELANCFSKITGIKKSDLLVSMAYTLSDGDWKWIDFKKLHGCATLLELIENQKSTFYQIYSGREVFLFYNSKEDAEKMGNYYFDKKDKSHRYNGSIICQKIEVGSENHSQGILILSISSYGRKFLESKQEKIEEVENTIRNIVLKQFEKRICIELSDLYIRERYKKYKSMKGPMLNQSSFREDKN